MSIDDVLIRIVSNNAQHTPHRDIALLRELVARIRPRKPHDVVTATDNIRALCFVLDQHPAWAEGLREYIANVVVTRKLVHLLTDTGITPNQGFWGAAWHRLTEKWLPPLINDDYLKDVFGQLFDRTDDHIWVAAVSDAAWASLFSTLGFRVNKLRPSYATVTQEILGAIQVLSYRVTAIGLESELVRNHPDIERFESPFLRQNDEINAYIAKYSAWLVDRKSEREDGAHVEVLLTQCEDIIVKIRRNAATQGASVSLTRLLLRVTQSIKRLRMLLDLLDSKNSEDAILISVRCLKELVTADNHKSSLTDLVSSNTELLSLQVTERAGRSGEHYVTNNRSEWYEMLRSALGAGFIVGFMATIKILFGKMLLAPFGYALLYSLNYSFGFMLIHVLHFTVATKQPAMTAALIAKSIDEGKEKLYELVELVVRVLRSQFIAIIGNVALAIPTAYAIAWAWYGIYGSHLVSPDKARHLLEDIDPIYSLALPHAAIAGVCLFLSGLISGYYDNKASYSNIPERLRQLKWLQKILGENRLNRITGYIGNNLGALAGNFFFGIMLGTIGQLGSFFGLPIDIRHITFSSANFAFALVGLDHHISWQLALYSLCGIMLIGMVNLGVSFSLALLVALRSRRVSFGRGGALALLILKRFFSGTRDFFFPPKDTEPVLSVAPAATSTDEHSESHDKPH
ncbi:site-specific recombinase [Undibacterium terreum]|uniref:Recombinase n=1 Tax=Undibacterium terreum TaxID=1224302 RepID=A0A916XSC4_9BURK|nr:site-specific recombinase [Undibacterium terreum]GGD01481.1 recombinase [Undibacterium terreum]